MVRRSRLIVLRLRPAPEPRLAEAEDVGLRHLADCLRDQLRERTLDGQRGLRGPADGIRPLPPGLEISNVGLEQRLDCGWHLTVLLNLPCPALEALEELGLNDWWPQRDSNPFVLCNSVGF